MKGTTLIDVQKHPIDRTRNVVITGIAEDRTDSAWRSKVADVLCAAAGHTIQICDAFRMGKFDAQRVAEYLVLSCVLMHICLMRMMLPTLMSLVDSW